MEDTPNFDLAGLCVGSQEVKARLLCKSPGTVLAGCPFFSAVFTELGCTVEWTYAEGQILGERPTWGLVQCFGITGFLNTDTGLIQVCLYADFAQKGT